MLRINNIRLDRLLLLFFCILITRRAEDVENKCLTCQQMLSDSQKSQMIACANDCESKHLVKNTFSNFGRTKLFACNEACQDTPEIRSKRICEMENCQPVNATASIPFQKCQFEKCQKFMIDYYLYASEQSEQKIPEKCKDISYSSNEEFVTISSNCAQEFYTSIAPTIDLYNHPLYVKLSNCLNNECKYLS